ncbi:MAG: FAD-dependent oxidoreductase [Flammeovirgaceae bacterium]|nr:FAD-dependent oxidoreductase [Flammeovirgaceae bacterium]
MEKYDLVVIGAGPSGYAAAMRAIDFKKKTLLVEKSRVGGAGVTNGALSSKTWWELSREAAAFRKNLRRYNIHAPSISYREIQSEVQKAVAERKDMLEEHMEIIRKSAAKYLDFKEGTARLISQNEIVISNGIKKEKVYADNIILATGSRPRYLPELPIDEKIVMTAHPSMKPSPSPRTSRSRTCRASA